MSGSCGISLALICAGMALGAGCRAAPPSPERDDPAPVASVQGQPGSPGTPASFGAADGSRTTEPAIHLEARVGCLNPRPGKDAEPCRFDSKFGSVAELRPGATLWIAAGATPDSEVLVIGKMGSSAYQVLARLGRSGAIPEPRGGAWADATPIRVGREIPTVVIVAAGREGLVAPDPGRTVECSSPLSDVDFRACDAFRQIERVVPPRPRCCVQAELDVVTAGERPLTALKATATRPSLAAVEFLFGTGVATGP